MSGTSTGRTVVVADDEPDIRELARLALERVGGHRVLVAADGRQAAELVALHDPDAVLLDVNMPGLDGPGTLRLMREQAAAAPVVFLTAGVQESRLAGLEELDVAGVLSKPFDPISLAAELGALLGWD